MRWRASRSSTPGGITPPFTYTNEDHRPTNRARLVMVKDGKIVQLREVSVERDMKWIGK